MRILFLCNTLYQIIVACCIRKMFPHERADIIFSDHSTSNKIIRDKFKTSNLIFDNTFYVESKYLYEYDKHISHIKRNKILKDRLIVPAMVDIAEEYDMFFCANAEPFTERVVNYVKIKNPQAVINWFEDGLSAYYYDQCYFPDYKGIIKSRLERVIFGVYRLTSYIDNYYVFNPDLMEWNPKASVKKITEFNKSLYEELGRVFKVSDCVDTYDEKYIFFEDGAQDWEKASDIELVNLIADKVGKENIIIRIHPRNLVNRFKKLGYKTNQDTSIPWEILVANMDIKNKVLITMYSQCVITPEILMGVKGQAIILANLDSNYEESNHEIFGFMNRAYFEKDKEHYIVPKNIDEFNEVIADL